MMEKPRFFSVSLDAKAKLRLERLSKKKERSQSWIAEKAIELLDEELI